MKLMLVLVGLLTVLGGALPFLRDLELMPESLKFIPVSGWPYQVIIIGIGIFAIFYGVKTRGH